MMDAMVARASALADLPIPAIRTDLSRAALVSLLRPYIGDATVTVRKVSFMDLARADADVLRLVGPTTATAARALETVRAHYTCRGGRLL